METNKIEVKVNILSFGGKLKETTITIDEIPLNVLTVDDWYSPTIGELCIDSDGKLDIVKDIKFTPSDGTFKACNMYTMEISGKQSSGTLIHRVEVKPGFTYILNGKVFRHQEALDGGYIDKIAKGEAITDYEYDEFDQ